MFLHQKENIINIDNRVRLTVDQFRALEPTYPSLPAGYVERYYEKNKRHDLKGPGKLTLNDGTSWDCGDRIFSRINDFLRLQQIIQQQEAAINDQVQAELNKRKSYEELRQSEYPKIEQMVIAMWENLIEKQSKKDSGISDLQKIREAIKEKYPKNEE
jgi:hypothetical protein